MSGPAWVGFLAASALALAFVALLYRGHEPAARARWVLGGLRAFVLVVLLLLLFDPDLRDRSARGAASAVLLDGSLSMRGLVDGETRWERALADIGEADALVFGEDVVRVAADSLAAHAPAGSRSGVLEAVRVAAEAGARRIDVWTDGELEDADAAAAAARGLGVDLTWRDVGGGAPANAGLAEFTAPRWGAPGDTLEASVAIAVAGEAGPDTLLVEVRDRDAVLGAVRIAAPVEGRLARATLPFVVPAQPGSDLRLEARVVPGGAHVEDDVRLAYLRVTEEGGGVVVVALAPDWETRFLLPTLATASGLRATGFLATGDGGFVRAGGRAGRASAGAVASAAREADVLVLLGAGEATPEWARALLRGGPPLVMLPAPDGSPPGLAITGPAMEPQEWYLTEAPPASPLASTVADLVVDSLPPLSGLRPLLPGAPPHRTVLTARRGRRGAEVPVLVIGGDGGRRWAAPVAEGFWRWSLRGGAARASYRRLWSAVLGWLMGAEPARGGDPVRPVDRVVARGAPQRWQVAAAADSLVVRYVSSAGDSLERRAPVVDGFASLDPLQPGEYAYEAALVGAEGSDVASGSLSVETYTREFLRPRIALTDVSGAAAVGVSAAGARPLHTRPWVYVLLLAALAAEWTLRRRQGLR